MRLVPRSMSGQLLVLWLLAMLVAHGIAVLMLSWWRVDNSSIHPMSARMIETRVAAAYRGVITSSDRTELLDNLSLPDSKYRIEPIGTDEYSMNNTELGFAQAIQSMLGLSTATPVIVQLQQIEPEKGAKDTRNWLEKALGRPIAWNLQIEIGLPDGNMLVSDHSPMLIPAHWNRVLSFSLLVGMIPTALIAIFFGRRIMRPLQTLTEAAKRVSRGERVILPPVSGPEGVREITLAFNDMQESLVRFVTGRTLMVAAIGHDLRTPLTSLRIRAELVEDDALRQAMVRTLDDMRVMVEEILRFSKDDAWQEPTVDVLVNDLIRDVIHDHDMQGQHIELQSQLDPSYRYRCRPVSLKRALNNLIDNAVCYGAVTVRAQFSPSRQLLTIEVLDDGPGIDADQLEHVFEPFVRLDTARSQATGGAGLGLTIAHSCVRAHGGNITLENREGGGLRAVIELPA